MCHCAYRVKNHGFFPVEIYKNSPGERFFQEWTGGKSGICLLAWFLVPSVPQRVGPGMSIVAQVPPLQDLLVTLVLSESPLELLPIT